MRGRKTLRHPINLATHRRPGQRRNSSPNCGVGLSGWARDTHRGKPLSRARQLIGAAPNGLVAALP